jgi:hypothetical protein
VTGDIGIDAGTVETAIGKMNQNLGASPDLFKELGVQVAYAKDGTVDANETFLNVVDRLNKIKDPAEKARVATKLLGKGWRDMSQLINMGADELRASLQGVSESKVIDPAEVEKAKKFRDAMDNLNDIVEDLSIALGETLVPALSDVAELAQDVAGAFDALKKIPGVELIMDKLPFLPLKVIKGGIDGIADAAKGVWDWFNKDSKPLISDEEISNMKQYREDLDLFNRSALNQIELGKKDPFKELRISAEKLSTELENVSQKWDMLTGKLDTRVALDNAQQALKDLEEAAADAFGTGSQEDLRIYNEKAAAFVGLLSGIAEGMGDISSRNILLTFETKGAAAALQLAQWLANGAELSGLSNLDLLTAAGISTLPARAMGGTVSAGGTYLVGERGPELLTVGAGGGHVSPMTGGGNTINITVTSADPNQVVAAIQQWTRNNGAIPLATTTNIRR